LIKNILDEYGLQAISFVADWKAAHSIGASENITGMKSHFDVLEHYKDGWKDGFSAAQPEQEPFEYWNAVEGWVKIEEVRKHFETVGCGTIYKTAGEDRVPLYTTPQQRPWVGLTDDEIKHLYPYGRSVWGKETYEAIEAKLKEKNT
jgi:hypothetical protein